MKKHTIRLALAATGIVTLAACGGGGGGGGSPSVPQAEITSSNAETTASATYRAIDTVGTGAPLSARSVAPADSVLALVNRQLGRVTQSSGLTRAAESMDCPNGGTMTVDVQDKNGDGSLDAGESVSFSFNNCIDSDGDSLNGGMKWVINSWDDSSGSVSSASVSISFNQLTRVSDGNSLRMHGDWTYAFSSTANGIDYSIKSSNFELEDGTELMRLRQIDHSVAYSSSSGATSFNVNGNVYTNAIGGEVSYQTSKPFVIASGMSYPYEGVLVITGANSSKLQVTAGACPTNAEAQLELMAAGQTSYGEPRCVLWSQLEG